MTTVRHHVITTYDSAILLMFFIGNNYNTLFSLSPGTPNEMITKKCAMGPCSLENNQNKALGLGCTDTSCSECCESDACNYAGAPRQIVVSVPLLVLLLALSGVVYQ